jgi:hypothetical protein
MATKFKMAAKTKFACKNYKPSFFKKKFNQAKSYYGKKILVLSLDKQVDIKLALNIKNAPRFEILTKSKTLS